MQFRSSMLTWALRFYPPMLMQRIWVQELNLNSGYALVKINKSLFTSNYNRTIFGGTIIAAVDPFFPILIYEALKAAGIKAKIWTKSIDCQFIKPANTDLNFKVSIAPGQITEVLSHLQSATKATCGTAITIFNAHNSVVAQVQTTISIKLGNTHSA